MIKVTLKQEGYRFYRALKNHLQINDKHASFQFEFGSIKLWKLGEKNNSV